MLSICINPQKKDTIDTTTEKNATNWLPKYSQTQEIFIFNNKMKFKVLFPYFHKGEILPKPKQDSSNK